MPASQSQACKLPSLALLPLRVALSRILLNDPAYGLTGATWQSFAILPSVRTVGVQGDGRTYAAALIVRAVTSEDAMTADFARIPCPVLERISSRMMNEVPGINRVAYDISSKPPATIEWEWSVADLPVR